MKIHTCPACGLPSAPLPDNAKTYFCHCGHLAQVAVVTPTSPPVLDPFEATTPQAFLDLCTALRDLGATEVTVGEFHAKFGPLPRPAANAPTRKAPEGFVSEERADQWRERAKRGG